MKNQETQACPSYAVIIAIAMIPAVISAVTVTSIYHSRFSHKIKVIDLKSYIRSQAVMLAAGEISKKQWQDNLDALEKQLQEESTNHVILLKEVVLRNGEELQIK